MGGPIGIWALIFSFLISFIIGIAENPSSSDLLRFILNVKPGIREPTSTTPSGKDQGRVVNGPAGGGLSGFNAISIANLGRGQSKSTNSQSMQSGGISQQQELAKGKIIKNENQKQIGQGLSNSTQNNQSAHVGQQKLPTSNQNQPKSMPSPPTGTGIAPSIVSPKPNAVDDPYGLEIGGNVEKTTTTTTITTTTQQTTNTAQSTTMTTTKMPPCGPDVLFVLDSTGSVRLVYNDQRNYILDVAKQIDIGPNAQHVGLILYSSKRKQRIVVGLDETKSKEEFLQIVRELPYHGGITATGTALELTVKALAKRRPNKRILVVVLTDGFTYDDWEIPSKNLHSLSTGVDVIVAGDVKHYARSILDKIAGDPSRVLLGEENKPKALDYLRCR